MAAGALYNEVMRTCFADDYQIRVIQFMQVRRVLSSHESCGACGAAMEIRPFGRCNDGFIWRCPQRECRSQRSVRCKSFFEKSRLPLKQWLLAMYYWSTNGRVLETSQRLGFTANTGVQIFQYLRDVCSWKMLQLAPIRLGGHGGLHAHVVEMDESCFSHKPKHHRGRPARHPVWVFGMVDTSVSPALGFMQVVDRRDAATLLPIIQNHVHPNTRIHSDQWAAYAGVAALPNVAAHQTVNHSLHFVDPATGTHTQHIESYWNRVKGKFKSMKGCHRHMIPSYLDEFMWKERFGTTHERTFTNIFEHIGLWYPVP